MKAIAIALFFLPVAALAQTTAAKPSTTECPDFKNKPQVSKAAYFESLRHKPATAPAAKKGSTAPAAQAKATQTKPQKAYVPSFSAGTDKILEEKKAPAAKTETAAKPAAEKPVVKEKEKEMLAETTTKPKAEKKTTKKKSSNVNSGKVRGTKKNAATCPAF
ncbi:MAG: hypothetical protein JWO44_1049 [Bacteroidetes bacterium]|nr:hypothetical protein [Bacteroidota bacterium]